MHSGEPISLEMEKELYLKGIDLFNEHDFFEAHETWEDVWRMAFGLKHSFYQGMIQAAVALEHYRRSNPLGVLSLSRTYPPKFKNLPKKFMGLDVPWFLGEMQRALAPVLTADPFPQRGQIELDLSTVPVISLEYDPFECGEAERYNRP